MRVSMSFRGAVLATWCLPAFFALATFAAAQSAAISSLSPNFGEAGSSITIYGTNFGTQRGSVTFNGTAATQLIWGSTQITAVVPAGAGTGAVEVTPSGGTAATSPAAFTVLAQRGMLVMGAFPPQSTNCSQAIPGYSGSDCIGDYQRNVIRDGNVDGVVIVVPWSKIDLGNSSNSGPGCASDGASSATCNWSFLDNNVLNYVNGIGWNAQKKVGIVLSPVTDNGPNQSTPPYVFTTAWANSKSVGGSAPLDECTCTAHLAYSGDSGAPSGCWNANTHSPFDTSGTPAAFEKPFYIALQSFYQSAVNHFTSHATYLPYIAYIRLGLSGGGETLPYCYADMEKVAGVTTAAEYKTVWTGYAKTMYVFEGGLNSHVPILAAPNGGQDANITDAWADTEAQDALNAGLSLGSQGLQFQDTIHVFSGRPCSNDWCNTFNDTPAPQIRQQQTLQQSDFQEADCGSNTSAGGNYHDTASLACLLPFVEGNANSVELYPGDMFSAFDSVNYTPFVSAYAKFIANAQSGH